MAASLFRSFLNKVAGVKAKNKHPVSHIEGADNVIVDSSMFCCPVCYNVFSSAPSILPCGHTFCGACIRNISMRDNLTTVVNQEWVFLCPMCRESCATTQLVRNYIIEDILQKVDEYPAKPEEQENLAESTRRLAKQRLEQRCAELELENTRLNRQLEGIRKKEKTNYVLIAFIVLFVNWIFLVFWGPR